MQAQSRLKKTTKMKVVGTLEKAESNTGLKLAAVKLATFLQDLGFLIPI
jgi:hypothetical protein